MVIRKRSDQGDQGVHEMKQTRKEIEAKYKELEKVHNKNCNRAYIALGKAFPRFVEYSCVLMFSRFIDFLSGDDMRERWECKECNKDYGCALLTMKDESPKRKQCHQGCQIANWEKVGAE